MKRCLVTRPEHDDTTYYLSHWMKDCIERAKAKGVVIIDLWRERANRKEFQSVVDKQKPNLILLNGHGSETTITGHKLEPLLVSGENEDLLKGKIVYALSCRSAKVLGEHGVKAGAQAYLGYKEDFIFVFNPQKITHPTQDKTAELFLKPSNELATALLKSQLAEETFNRSQSMFRENIKKLLSSEASKEDTALVRYLWWDMKNQVCLGNKSASF